MDMNEQVHTSYDTVGSSSYLTMALPDEVKVVHYRLEMLTSNEITQLLPVSKRVVDGENVLYFNISSLFSLEQILERRKLKKDELITIMEGLVRAAKDAEDYQLPISGFVMEPAYIFVDSATCKPFFAYLPIEGTDENGHSVKSFFQNLIMQGKLELTNDNFIQVLLNALNQEPFTVAALEKCIKDIRSSRGTEEARKVTGSRNLYAGNTPQRKPENISANPPVQPVNWNGAPQPAHSERNFIGENIGAQATGEMGVKTERPETPGKPLPPQSKKETRAAKKNAKKKEKPVKKEKKVSNPAVDESFDAEKAKKKFLLPQAIVMVAVSAMISFGFFVDGETGAVAVNNILAAVILIVLFEVILYREVFVNSKKKGGSSSSGKKDKKAVKQAGQNGKRPAVPGQKPQVPNQNQPSFSRPAAPEASVQERPVISQSAQPVSSIPMAAPQPIPMPAAPVVPERMMGRTENVYAADSSEMDETQLAGDEGSDMPVYLEYYENGVLTRVPLERASTLIGRLRSQVDFAVTNPRVGKIHAEFIVRDGKDFVKDLNSKNGTYINGNPQRLGSNVEYPLNDRDRVSMADSEFTLRCSSR